LSHCSAPVFPCDFCWFFRAPLASFLRLEPPGCSRTRVLASPSVARRYLSGSRLVAASSPPIRRKKQVIWKRSHCFLDLSLLSDSLLLALPSLAATTGRAAAPFVLSSPSPLPATSASSRKAFFLPCHGCHGCSAGRGIYGCQRRCA